MKVSLEIFSQRVDTCTNCPHHMRFSADQTMVLCRKRGGSEKRECPRCWAWLGYEAHVQGCPIGRWPDQPAKRQQPEPAADEASTFKIITKPGQEPYYVGEPPDWLLPTLKIKPKPVPRIVFPVKHASPEWYANMKACRACKHYRNARPELCAVDGRQCSTHAIHGDCPKKLQPHHKDGPIVAVEWPKLPAMPAAPSNATLPFPIDIVYTWVDGSDPAFLAEFQKYLPKSSPRGSRFVDCDELKYSLRSVERFAPWVRYVHLVTNGQVPKWLNVDHPKLRLVTHQQIFANPEFLPVFNSIAIEQNLHRIPELSEHFLYANDDMMFGRPAQPDQFFTHEGKAKIAFAGRISNDDQSKGFRRFCYNARQALVDAFGERPYRQAIHQIQPLIRSALAEIEDRFPTLARTNSANRLRHHTSAALNSMLWPAYMFAAGHAVETTIDSRYVRSDGEQAMRNAIRSPKTLVCINNSVPGNAPTMRKFFAAYLPEVSRFERSPKWTSEIVQVVNTFDASGDEARRMRDAQATWPAAFAADGNWRLVEHRLNEKDRSSKDLGDSRQVPYIRDLFDHAAAHGTNDEAILLFANSDIRIVPDAGAAIRRALETGPCCYSHRVNTGNHPPAFTQKDLGRKRAYVGIDLFACRKSWWLAWRERIPDFLLGCSCWDSAWHRIMDKQNARANIKPPIIYHVNHSSFWLVHGEANPGEKYNRELFAAWKQGSL